MVRSLISIIEFTCALLYAIFLPVLQKKKRRIVIYYHGVMARHTRQFARQMAYLAAKRHVVKASQILTDQSHNDLVAVAITFDDALTSFYKNALPILQEHKLPATIFVPAGNLGKPPGWAFEQEAPIDDETVMNEQQIAQVDQAGYEIMSHTLTHPYLTCLDDARLEAELNLSKQMLQSIVAHDISAVSYPYGLCNARTCAAARRAGYQIGFTVEPYSVDSSPDNLQIGRVAVSPQDSMLKFRLKVSGAYQVVTYLRKVKRIVIRVSRAWRSNK